MTALTYQRLLARLVVDHGFFDRYVASPERALASAGIDPASDPRLCRVEASQLSRFREIVHGTRRATFELVLAELVQMTGRPAWDALVTRFQREVVIPDSGGWRDLEAFCRWLDAEFPGSVGADVARYLATAQRLGRPPDPVTGTGLFRRSPAAGLLCTGHEHDLLWEAGADEVWLVPASGGTHHYALLSEGDGDELEVLELTPHAYRALVVLEQPRTAGELAGRLGLDTAAGREVLDELASAGLICEVEP